MWRITGVSPSIWCLFLLPAVTVGVAATIARSYRWFYIFGFTWTSLATAFIESYYRIYVAQELDEKFRHAPSAQFEIDLTVDAIIGIVGLLILSATLGFLWRSMQPRGSRAVFISAITGTAYTLVPVAINALGWDLPVPLFWVWAFTFPVVSARMAVRSRPRPVTGSPAMHSQNPLLR